MSDSTRIEKDPLGELAVPASALYGVQTMRATQNFPISGLRPLPIFVTATVWIKKAAALTHAETGRLDRLSGGLCRSGDLESACDYMIRFAAAGFRAVCRPAAYSAVK